MVSLLIGEVADRTGLTAPTIRYYESVGLIKPPARSESGYRRYPDTTIEELRFIKKAQGLGFSLDEIAEILKLSRTGRAPCSHVLNVSRRHLAAVDERIKQLRRFRRQLAGEIAKWDGRQKPTCDGLCQIIASAPDTGHESIRIDVRPHDEGRRRRGLISGTEVKHGQRERSRK